MRQASHRSLLLGPIDRFGVVKVVVGVWSAVHLVTALLALLVIVGGFDLSNAHPRVAAAPFESAIWHGAWALLGWIAFRLTERRRQQVERHDAG